MFGLEAWQASIVIMVLFVAAVLTCLVLVWRVGRSASKQNSDLVRCRQCGRSISRQYATCPECGHAMPSANDASGALFGKSPINRPSP
jgi:predicted amidophosphoribosyltransferase